MNMSVKGQMNSLAIKRSMFRLLIVAGHSASSQVLEQVSDRYKWTLSRRGDYADG
jgi:hypothetical protein